MSMTETESPYLTVPETAKLLQIPRERCYQLIACGTIPSIRLSERRIRIPRRVLMAWLEVQEREAVRSLEQGPNGT